MAISQLLGKYFSTANSDQVGKVVEDANFQAIMRRRSHERRWYDNQFFDDGFHFRLVSKRTGRVIDTVNRSSGYVERAIPRASRQIRGIGNLLFSPQYYPVVYPERITQENFRDRITGQVNEAAFKKEQERAKENARKAGIWITTKWEDELDLPLKLIEIILGAAKQSIGYIQVYTDPVTNRLCADTLDAFDMIHYGDYKNLDDLPFITKATPWDFKEVLNSPVFEEEKLARLTPDNTYATSEIKNAYMRVKFGSKLNTPQQNTIIVRETFIREYLSDDNWKQAIKLGEATGAMEGKSRGDAIMRHPFSAGGVTLKDEYVNYDNYPFAEFRFEPGYLYQVPLIERFIPLNKALDVVVTRLEKWVNAMVVGVYMTRKGENIMLSNWAGGQQVSYETAKPEQMQVTNAGSTPFQLAEMIDKYLEEQGASTFTLNSLPQGVTANAAFESSQQREYANMKFSTMMLKKTITRVAELMMERGHKDIIEPEEVSYKEDGKPSYFTVIGKDGAKAQKKVNNNLPHDIVTLDRRAKVHVEIDQGLGLTPAGKKEAMTTIMDHLVKLYELGFLSASALSLAVKRELETYGYGSTEEFMEEVENGVTQGTMDQQQIQKMQIAILKTLKDTGLVGPQAQKNQVMAAKVGTLESLKESGLAKNIQDGVAPVPEKDLDEDMVRIYKDAPPDVRREIEQKLGLTPSQEEPMTLNQAKTAKDIHGIVHAGKQHDLETVKTVADTTLQTAQLQQQKEQAAEIQAQPEA